MPLRPGGGDFVCPPHFSENRHAHRGIMVGNKLSRAEGAMDMVKEREVDGAAWTRRIWAVGLGLLAMVFLLPLLLFSGAEPLVRAGEMEPPAPTASLPILQPPTVTPVPGWDTGQEIRLLHTDGEVETMTLQDYLWGVVAAEMPASFHLEALKAQAVAARTYCLYQMRGGGDKHPGADICGDYTCCQAYVTPAQAVEGWGEDHGLYTDKITQAVAGTDGLLCLYGGAPIDAVFFSSAAGKTSDAVEVWGTQVPYLVPVDSPEGEEVPGWKTVVTFTLEEFRARFLESFSQADLSGPAAGWFSEPTLDSSRAVSAISVGGVEVTGAQARQALGLRSAHFTVEPGEETVVLHVTGYGHGVGMSQYGANALAAQGKDFAAILKWYYTGISVSGLET